MLRLLHGDVGSGKTVIAAMAALRSTGSGYQTAITAPTELLAEQHFRVFSEWLEPLAIHPVWLSGKVTGSKRSLALQRISDGAEVIIGTHALMQKGVEFKRLGLVIVDEQHRFGVDQRMDLLQKGGTGEQQAHQLIMTATPIPRTLAMTAYAGMDVSVIDELPPGRKPVTTVVMSNERRGEVIRRVAKACAAGQQAYWVCTLIEESDVIEAQAAEDVAAVLNRAMDHMARAGTPFALVMRKGSVQGVRVLENPGNRGKGYSVRHGMLAARRASSRMSLSQVHIQVAGVGS